MEIFADTGCAVLVSFLFIFFLHIANKQVVSSYKLEETRGGGAIDLLEKKKNSKGSTSVNSSPVGDALCLFQASYSYFLFSAYTVCMHDADAIWPSSDLTMELKQLCLQLLCRVKCTVLHLPSFCLSRSPRKVFIQPAIYSNV